MEAVTSASNIIATSYPTKLTTLTLCCLWVIKMQMKMRAQNVAVSSAFWISAEPTPFQNPRCTTPQDIAGPKYRLQQNLRYSVAQHGSCAPLNHYPFTKTIQIRYRPLQILLQESELIYLVKGRLDPERDGLCIIHSCIMGHSIQVPCT